MLSNNGTELLSVGGSGDVAFRFPESLASGDSFLVEVRSQPTGQSCEVLGGSGTLVNGTVGSVLVNCTSIHGISGTVTGLALLDVATVMQPDKRVALTQAIHCESGAPLRGYEIHLGETTGPDCARPFARIGTRADGAISYDGRVQGTYLHGIFADDGFRSTWLARFGAARQNAYSESVNRTLDELAAHLETHLSDVDGFFALAR